MAPHSHESDEDDELAEPASVDANDRASDGAHRHGAGPTPRTAPAPADGDRSESAGTTAPTRAPTTSADTAPTDTAWRSTTAASGRRMSGFDEVVDGGFGLGSAAPIDDGAQPLGHDVKGQP